jgi:hypothetical protein
MTKPDSLSTSSVINAFHPDYMKTYEPNFMKFFRTLEANAQDRRESVIEAKNTRSMTVFPKTRLTKRRGKK